MNAKNQLSRRDFLKMFAASLGSIALRPWKDNLSESKNKPTIFPDAEHLARVAYHDYPFVKVRARPDIDSPEVGVLYSDDVVPWLREVVGKIRYNPTQRWVETPTGYVWSPLLQPVKNIPNTPISSLEETITGLGMWVEVTIPYVDIVLENNVGYEYWTHKHLQNNTPMRLYYGQVIWVDDIRTDENGQVLYRLNEQRDLDIFWGNATAFRPISEEELSLVSPEVENKRVDVNVDRQTVSCFEDEREVFFCRASTGNPALAEALGEDGSETSTPPGLWHRIWRKSISAHMGGGGERGGWDTPAIGYASYFVGTGVAIHSTFWHNGFGEKWSHGCVNVSPENAKWIFRWTTPYVPYVPGDLTVTGDVGTLIRVLES
jgi:lipoprotein-anchoring transpeptidase ErfK/SrfK